MKSVIMLLPALLSFANGCGGAGLVLKSPVQNKCETAGLRGCPDIADGVILFAEGNQGEGTKKLLEGAAQNPPEQLRQFAEAIKQLKDLPGAGEFASPLLKVADLLTKGGGPADKQAKPVAGEDRPCPPGWPMCKSGRGRPPSTRVAAHAEADEPSPNMQTLAIVADTDVWRIRTGMTSPSQAPGWVACSEWSGNAYGLCAKVIEGPFVVTNLQAGHGCKDELFVASGPAGGTTGSPRWALDRISSIHGARLLVKHNEALYVGQASGSEAALQRSAECRVTWSGFRPYSGQGDWTAAE